jgi:hypothetical protein
MSIYLPALAFLRLSLQRRRAGRRGTMIIDGKRAIQRVCRAAGNLTLMKEYEHGCDYIYHQ